MATIQACNRALQRLPDHVREQSQQTIDTTAFHIARDASRRAPRRSGTLKGAIVWRSRPRSVSAVVGVESDAFYWKFLEYGTVKMEARPMFRPAAEALASDHDQRMRQGLERALARMAREAR